ncbi:BEN domain protein [Squirrelpox virus]|uniref:BEN domain protein n=1 Tax=Squirrelpox virus TaxID=240426 RepID=U3UBG1_9POXV|nr:BEN domain protein [Squirrelpox virus]CCD83211.1 BEN domain protein [Squirrelpox virus]
MAQSVVAYVTGTPHALRSDSPQSTSAMAESAQPVVSSAQPVVSSPDGSQRDLAAAVPFPDPSEGGVQFACRVVDAMDGGDEAEYSLDDVRECVKRFYTVAGIDQIWYRHFVPAICEYVSRSRVEPRPASAGSEGSCAEAEGTVAVGGPRREEAMETGGYGQCVTLLQAPVAVPPMLPGPMAVTLLQGPVAVQQVLHGPVAVVPTQMAVQQVVLTPVVGVPAAPPRLRELRPVPRPPSPRTVCRSSGIWVPPPPVTPLQDELMETDARSTGSISRGSASSCQTAGPSSSCSEMSTSVARPESAGPASATEEDSDAESDREAGDGAEEEEGAAESRPGSPEPREEEQPRSPSPVLMISESEDSSDESEDEEKPEEKPAPARPAKKEEACAPPPFFVSPKSAVRLETQAPVLRTSEHICQDGESHRINYPTHSHIACLAKNAVSPEALTKALIVYMLPDLFWSDQRHRFYRYGFCAGYRVVCPEACALTLTIVRSVYRNFGPADVAMRVEAAVNALCEADSNTVRFPGRLRRFALKDTIDIMPGVESAEASCLRAMAGQSICLLDFAERVARRIFGDLIKKGTNTDYSCYGDNRRAAVDPNKLAQLKWYVMEVAESFTNVTWKACVAFVNRMLRCEPCRRHDKLRRALRILRAERVAVQKP